VQVSAGEGAVNNRRQGRRASQAKAWRPYANEYPTGLAGRTASTQVGRQSLAHIRRKGHPVVNQPLAANEELASSPVDVLEPESYHLTGAETKTGQQKQDGIVASAGRCAAVAGLEYTFDFLRRQVFGHRGKPPVRYREHRSGQVDWQLPLLKQEPKERTESCRHQLCSSDTHALAMPQNEIRNIGSFHRLNKEWPFSEARDEKLASEILVMGDRGDYEPAL